jgi:hypothetical protein
MTDPIIANAQRAAETPADGPPAPVMTPEQQKLNEMTGGRYAKTLAARAAAEAAKPPVVEEPAPAPPTAAEKMEARRRHLNDPKNADGVWSLDQAKADAARADLKRLLARNPEDPASRNADNIKDAADAAEWAGTLRSRYGIQHPRFANGDTVDPLHEGNALAYLTREGVAPDVVKNLATDVYGALNGGGVLDDATIERLKSKYGGALGSDRVALLEKWYREEVLGGDGA